MTTKTKAKILLTVTMLMAFGFGMMLRKALYVSCGILACVGGPSGVFPFRR